jgi:hypothetical protein
MLTKCPYSKCSIFRRGHRNIPEAPTVINEEKKRKEKKSKEVNRKEEKKRTIPPNRI